MQPGTGNLRTQDRYDDATNSKREIKQNSVKNEVCTQQDKKADKLTKDKKIHNFSLNISLFFY